VDGHNVAIEYRFAEGRFERLPEMAADLVRRGVDVLAASGGSPSVLAAKAATTTIPIVLYDRRRRSRAAGIVASLSRPGGNITGVSLLGGSLGPKRLEILPTTTSRRKIRWPSRLFRGISMACEDLVVGCFLDDRAPLAVPELNRERTLKYLECCYKQGMSWKDAEQQIHDCLQQRGVPREGILRQLKLARPLLQPWLD